MPGSSESEREAGSSAVREDNVPEPSSLNWLDEFPDQNLELLPPPPYSNWNGDTAEERKAQNLHEAIYLQNLPKIKDLLHAGVSLTSAVSGKTPLQLILTDRCWDVKSANDGFYQKRKKHFIEIIEELSKEIPLVNNILEHQDENGDTLLVLAIKTNDYKVFEAVIKAGVKIKNTNDKGETLLHKIKNTNDKGETLLHLAAKFGAHILLQSFIENYNIKYSADINGNFPLHCAAASRNVESAKLLLNKYGRNILKAVNKNKSTVWHVIARHDSIEIAKHLFENYHYSHDDYSHLYMFDGEGKTPVHIAASKGHEDLTALFLSVYGLLSVEGEKTTVVEHVFSEFADPRTFLEKLFDNWIIRKEMNTACVPFCRLTDNKRLSQIDVIDKIAKREDGELLKHPLIECLIFLKWKRILPVFYIMIVMYLSFLVVFSAFVTVTFIKIDANTNVTEKSALLIDLNYESRGVLHWVLAALLYVNIVVLSIQEGIYIYIHKQKLRYLKRRESWVGLAVLVLAFSVPPAVGCAPVQEPVTWQRHLACFAVLLAWLQALMLLARSPGLTFYDFEMAAINMLKVFGIVICMLVGFAICFIVQYQSQPPFDGPFSAITKTLMMMTEFDYEALIGDDHDAQLKATRTIVRVLLIIFVIFVTTLLTNFLIGVAVSDLNQLNATGSIRRLKKQVELLSTLEHLGDTVFGKYWNRLASIRYQECMHRDMQDPGQKWNVSLFKNYDDSSAHFKITLTAQLQDSIYNIIRKKKHSERTLDMLYDAVVGIRMDITKLEDKINSIEATLKKSDIE